MRSVLLSLAAGVLLTVLTLGVADRLTADCADHQSAPACPSVLR